MKTLCPALIGAAVFLAAPFADAAQSVVPTRGQNQATQQADEADCGAQAAQQSGFTPGAPTAGAPTGSAGDTSAISNDLGALGGGLQGGPAGALGGGGPGDAGAAVSALTTDAGGAAGELSAAAPQSAGTQADYDKARAACLASRGYSVH